MAGLFQVLWGQADGTFKRASSLKGTDGQPLAISVAGEGAIGEAVCTRPTAVDWDADGDLDLVVGNFVGKFYLFTGEDGGKFAPAAQPINAGGAPLRLRGEAAMHGDPFVIDWDKDGDLDLLSGSSEGGVQWAENGAGPGKPPRLEAFRSLIEKGPQVAYGQILREEDLKGPVGNTRVWADDVNGDGKLDLLVGDSATLISPADNVTEEEFKQKFAEWTKSQQEVVAQLNSDADEKKQAEAQKRYQELYQRRTEFMKEDRTGFIWLYLRK